MNRRRDKRRQSGALLLMVALLLATMAALSFGLNRAAGMDARSVQGDYDSRAVDYLAEAAVAATKWSNQIKGCTSTAVPLTAFGPGTFVTTVTKASSKRLNITATATIGDMVRTLSPPTMDIVDFSKTESKDLGGAALDTTIDYGRLLPDSGRGELALVSNLSHALLYWPALEVPADSRVVSATLILTQDGTNIVRRPVSVHRMTTQWDVYATWRYARAYVGWTGGDYGTTAVSTVPVAGASTYSWDVTGLVDGWATGRVANYGMLLRLADPGQAVTFHSLDAAARQRPVLRVVTAKAC